MIRHAVLFSFKDEASEDQREALLADTARFPEHHPAMRGFALGPNTSERDQRYKYMLVIDFDTRADLDEYQQSEIHVDFVTRRFIPLVGELAVATIEFDR